MSSADYPSLKGLVTEQVHVKLSIGANPYRQVISFRTEYLKSIDRWMFKDPTSGEVEYEEFKFELEITYYL